MTFLLPPDTIMPRFRIQSYFILLSEKIAEKLRGNSPEGRRSFLIFRYCNNSGDSSLSTRPRSFRFIGLHTALNVVAIARLSPKIEVPLFAQEKFKLARARLTSKKLSSINWCRRFQFDVSSQFSQFCRPEDSFERPIWHSI